MPLSRPPSFIATLRPGLTAILLTLAAVTVEAATIEEQRAAFRDVYKAAERGEWAPVEARRDVLEDYILWPDLRAAWLRRNLDDEDAVVEFLATYPALKPTRNIRFRFARQLMRRGRHADYLSIYAYHYADLGDATLDCLAANARIELGYHAAAFHDAERLWLIGRSQDKACDPVFAWLRKSGRLDRRLLQERYALAIEALDFGLARYLARSLDQDHLDSAQRWLQARDNSLAFLRTADLRSRTPEYMEQLTYAAKRLARRDPEAAYLEWRRIRTDFRVEREQDLSVAREVALWSARRARDGSKALMAKLPAAAIDDEVRRWQIRDALRRQDWLAVANTIESLQGEEANDEEWRYWLAVAYERTGRHTDARLAFRTLAAERSYYGFLAADQIGQGYALEDQTVAADEAVIAELRSSPAIQRARELFLTGLDGRARSEWNEATRDLDEARQAQAALLADRWGWHSRAIATAARIGHYDSLQLRYPLPHRSMFTAAAAKAGIPEAWAYGIARSESIFMRDVRSSAGAIGLMQLMPATGRSTAAELSLPYRGVDTLVDPASNIRLGTWYLGKMHDRFGQHAALATAAYNAGPHRVSQWLPEQRPIDARIWVETIPFNETRDYVRRVLTADVIFQWRLSGQPRRLSDHLTLITPATGRQAPAAAAR